MAITVEVQLDPDEISDEDIVNIARGRGLKLEDSSLFEGEVFRAESEIERGFVDYAFEIIIKALPSEYRKPLEGHILRSLKTDRRAV